MVTEAVVHLSPLSSSGSGAAQAERPPSLQSGAGAGQRYTAVYWPVGASPQTGRLAGRWRAAAGLGGCQIVWGSWGKMATTAGAAP